MKKVLSMLLAIAMTFPVGCAGKDIKKEKEYVLKSKARAAQALVYCYSLLAVVAAGSSVIDEEDESFVLPITKELCLKFVKHMGCAGAFLWAAGRCADYRDYYYGKLNGEIKDDEPINPEDFEIDSAQDKIDLLVKAVVAGGIAIIPAMASSKVLLDLLREFPVANQNNYPFWFKRNNMCKFVLMPIVLPVAVGAMKKWGPYSLKLLSELKNKLTKKDQFLCQETLSEHQKVTSL